MRAKRYRSIVTLKLALGILNVPVAFGGLLLGMIAGKADVGLHEARSAQALGVLLLLAHLSTVVSLGAGTDTRTGRRLKWTAFGANMAPTALYALFSAELDFIQGLYWLALGMQAANVVVVCVKTPGFDLRYCTVCDYDLSGTLADMPCPECGTRRA